MLADTYKALAQASFRLSSNLAKKGIESVPVFGGRERTVKNLYYDAVKHFRTAAHCKCLPVFISFFFNSD